MLTPKEEIYVRERLKGKSQRQAYKVAFDCENMSDNTIDKKACELWNDSKIRGRYQELLKEVSDEAIMSARERMIYLTEVARGDTKEEVAIKVKNENVIAEVPSKLDTRLKALDTLNKMDGSYQENINIKGNINNPLDNMSTEEVREALKNLGKY